jgi:hypothetical protein
LLNRLGLWVQMEFILNQFPSDSRHVSKLPCKDVPIFLEEFNEREFLFGIQGVAYMSNLGRFLCRQPYLYAECVLRLDGRFGGLGVGHDRVRGVGGGGSTKDSFHSRSSTDVVSLSAISQLSLSQSWDCLTSPLMELTPRDPGIFSTK